MVSALEVLYYAVHPVELRSIIQWKFWHDPVHRRPDDYKETPTEKSCYHFLNLTSRSFAAVIQELHPDLLLPVALFYLVLRGLDTIEDDMTIDIKEKEPLLRSFHEKMEIDGWTYNGNGPNEKDRELLVHFEDVIVELKKVKAPYYAIIKDITIKMENGMADYAVKAANGTHRVQTIKEYEQYCHYVAGLVGEGLTQLFVEGKLANPKLLERPELQESMGQFLQKTNIIRDVREDYDDGRQFWPQEIWSKYFDKFEDMFLPENRTKAVHCQSHMVLNALKHAEECLYYMAGMKEQSVFNFVAIPQAMAIATLELVFQNPAMFDRNLKIKKGVACALMGQSTQNLRILCDVFRGYARKIHQKNDPRDPNYTAISIQCAKIERFIESIFPTQDFKQIQTNKAASDVLAANEGKMDMVETLVLVGAILTVLFLLGGMMIGAAYVMGARFDKVIEEQGVSAFMPSIPGLFGGMKPDQQPHDEL